MLVEDDEMILENIDEFVNDENKIVSYKWLSLTLSIHVNKSKRLLDEYIRKQSENCLQIIYFVNGVKTQNGEQKFECILSTQASLNNVLDEFSDVLSCHVYSIQKSKVKNPDILYETDVDITKQNLRTAYKYNAIRCAVTENVDETRSKPKVLQSMPVSAQVIAPVNNNAEKKKGKQTESPPLTFFKKKPAKKQEEGGLAQSNKREKTVLKAGSGVVQSKSSHISKAFSKFTENPNVSKAKMDVKSDVSSRNVQPTHLASKAAQPVSKELTVENSVESPMVNKKRKVIDDEESDDDFESFVKKTKEDVTSKSFESQKVEDSMEHSVESRSDEDIDVVAPTPEPVKVKSKTKRRKKNETNQMLVQKSPPKVHPEEMTEKVKNDIAQSPDTPKSRRRRRKVLKSKHFQNEDGFMVTKKIYESESCSDESSDNAVSPEENRSTELKGKTTLKNTETDSKDKSHQNKRKHQSSLTSFFKKK